jgi:hypothetical protein
MTLGMICAAILVIGTATSAMLSARTPSKEQPSAAVSDIEQANDASDATMGDDCLNAVVGRPTLPRSVGLILAAQQGWQTCCCTTTSGKRCCASSPKCGGLVPGCACRR